MKQFFIKKNRMFNLKEALTVVNNENNLYKLDSDTLKHLQNVLLEIYLDIVAVSPKYDIKVFLAGGSVLGAIRHEGFIPWDDDLDIGMIREDFNRFKKIFKQELSDKYILSSPNYDCHSKSRFPIIIKKGTLMRTTDATEITETDGIKVDLFVLDNIPNNVFLRIYKGCLCNILEFAISQIELLEDAKGQHPTTLVSSMGRFNYLVRIIVGWCFSFKKSYQWFNILDNLIQYNRESDYCGFVTGRKHYFGEIMPKKEMFPMQSVKFAGINVFVFKNPDYYLKRIYGDDYMILPPESKRESHFIREIKFE